MTEIVGILNITPDSFSDGGKFNSLENALSHAKKLIEDGVDVIDIGAESTRPNAIPLTPQEEWQRLEKILPALISFLKNQKRKVLTSIDSYHFENIVQSYNLGVDIINDVKGLSDDRIVHFIAEKKIPTILMHNDKIVVNDQLLVNKELGITLEIIRWAKNKINYLHKNGVEKSQGVYYNEAQVTLSTETAGASIYYTINGDEPTTASTLYTAPFTVTATATVKALAVKTAMTNSAVMQRMITIINPAVGALPFEELFNASLNDFYAFSKAGDQIWGPASYSSGTYPTFAKVSGYSGGNKENEDWLISPKFTASAALGLQLSFASATGFAGNALQLKYSTNYSGFGDPTIATWTDITTQASWPAENSNYAWVESGNIVIAGTMPVHFAFVYNSTTTAAATWEVAKVKVIDVPVGPTISVTEVSVPGMMAVVGASGTETIHVSGLNLTADISLAVSGKNANRFAVSAASLTQTGGVVENTVVTITYTPSAEVADTATLTLSSAGANSVVFELTGKGIVLAGAGTTENPFTVADVKKLNNSFASATKYWVRGYIIGVPSAGNAEGNLTTVDLEPEFTGATAIALSDIETETDLTKMIGVQLPTGAVRTALNLVDNAANYKKLVKVYGTLEAYFTAAPGVKNVSEYAFIETSLPKVDANDFKVYTSAGKLQVDAVESSEIVVFDVIGKQIYKGLLQAGNNAINLPHRGVMVVKINNSTAKVVL